ncbi:MAG: DUF58 domain-containing protein [Longimicrobiales bacterium]|nr:DUF58 domain-containing protein [Longimicrobiales bacterium]
MNDLPEPAAYSPDTSAPDGSPPSGGTGIPEELVQELRYLEIHTRRKITSRLIGSYTSPFKGVGFDFWEHRRYQPGEDVRRIDWNATARLGQIQVKLDHAEREMNAMLVVDLSRSMEFTSRRLTKRELLLRVAGCLAFSAIADQMHLGLLAFTDRVEAYLPPRQGRRQAWRILQYLWDARPQGGGTELSVPIRFLAQRLRKTTLLFVVSDFLEGDVTSLADFQLLGHHHDLVPIVVRDPLEEALLQARGHVRLRDLESGEEQVISLSARNRRAYAEEVEQRRAELIRQFYAMGLDHVYLRVGDAFVDPLIRMFSTRKRQQR